MVQQIHGWRRMQKANQLTLTGLSNQLMKEHRMADQDFTHSKEYLFSIFDYIDGKLFWIKPLSPNKRLLGMEAGSATKHDRYKKVMIDKKSYKVHRLVYFMHHNYFPVYIDHINGNTFDNRIENLRDVTYTQNNQNAKIRKDSTSGVKGVYLHKATGKWTASCQANKKRLHLGLFDTIEEAEKAVKSAREQLHGSFARHN